MTAWGRDTVSSRNWVIVNDPLAVLEWEVFRTNTRPPTGSKHDL